MMAMRPKGSGYRSQSRLLEVMRKFDMSFQEAADLLRSRGSASRNLKELVMKGLAWKYRSGHRVLYAATEKGSHWTEWEKRQVIKRLLEQPPWHETPEGKEWLSKLPREYDETLDDTETRRLREEYQDEISELLQSDEERLRNANVYEMIAWAMEYRRVKTDLESLRSYGAREPRIEPRTKKPKRFKHSE